MKRVRNYTPYWARPLAGSWSISDCQQCDPQGPTDTSNKNKKLGHDYWDWDPFCVRVADVWVLLRLLVDFTTFFVVVCIPLLWSLVNWEYKVLKVNVWFGDWFDVHSSIFSIKRYKSFSCITFIHLWYIIMYLHLPCWSVYYRFPLENLTIRRFQTIFMWVCRSWYLTWLLKIDSGTLRCLSIIHVKIFFAIQLWNAMSSKKNSIIVFRLVCQDMYNNRLHLLHTLDIHFSLHLILIM